MKKKLTKRKNTQQRNRKVNNVPPINNENQKTTKTYTFLKLASRLFLTIAILSFVIFFNLLLIRTFPVPKREILGAADKKYPQPTEIIITAVGIDIPVYPAHISHGTYETSTLGASYLASSPIPGQTGNSIIYAHNWWNLFGSLYHVKKGEKVEVVFADNSRKSFTIASTQTVHANQVSILHNTTDQRLTLFTCANFLDADRFVVTAMADK